MDPFSQAIATALLKKATGHLYDFVMSGYMSDTKAEAEASKYCYAFGARFEGDSGARMIGVRKSGNRIYFDEIHKKVLDVIGRKLALNSTNMASCHIKRDNLAPAWANDWHNYSQVACDTRDGYTIIDGDDKWGNYRGGKFRNVVGEYNVTRTAAATAGTWMFGPVGILASAAVGAGSVVWNRATKNMVLTSYEVFYAIVYARCKLVLRSAEILADRGSNGILIKYEDSADTGGTDRSVVVSGQFWHKVFVY